MDISQFYQEQLQQFGLAQKNYRDLDKVVYRDLHWKNFSLRIQHNPARILSTNARLDKDSQQNHSCFLCKENMPAAQQGIPYLSYHLYINPYPVFPQHFTVAADRHIPQRIENHFEDLLNLAFELPEWVSFYNGPACGASAPGHLHFQMVPRHSMPLEKDAENLHLRHILVEKDFYRIYTLQDYLRKVILLQASDLRTLTVLFSRITHLIGEAIPYEDEPRMNILVWFDNCQWTVCLFPRKVHRPRQFFETGEQKILFSPGCIDMAGVIIAPREEDFNKYSKPLLTDLFGQVSADEKSWEYILCQMQNL